MNKDLQGINKGIANNKSYQLLDDGFTNIEFKSRSGAKIFPIRVIDPAVLANI